MLIFSNAFPTNMPNAEQFSQGGPANFAKLFVNYISKNHKNHKWVGVMLDGVSTENDTKLKEIFNIGQRKYFKLSVPKGLFKNVLQAKSISDDPRKLWDKPISRLKKLIKQTNPDIMFLNGFGVLNWMLLKASEETGVPVIIQHAGIWTKELNLHKEKYSPAGLKLLKQMEKDSTRIVAREIFLNTWSRDYYRKNVAKAPESKTDIVPLPFDFSGFEEIGQTTDRPKFAFNKKLINIGIIARWDKIKNHKAVLSMAKYSKKNNLPIKFHSIVEIPDRAEFTSSKKIYSKYVNVIQPQDRIGISSFCDSVDMLMLPSFFDVSPTVVLEAISTNTPIIISPNIGYVHDFENYGGADWVIDPSNASKAVKNILKLKNKKTPKKLKERILSIHDHNKVFATYIKIFDKVSKGN